MDNWAAQQLKFYSGQSIGGYMRPRRSACGYLTFQDLSVLEVPDMAESGSWWYRPDMFRTQSQIRSGANKTFGRSSQGSEAAKKAMNSYLRDQLTLRNWEIPRLMGREGPKFGDDAPYIDYEYNKPTFKVWWRNSPFGVVVLALMPHLMSNQRVQLAYQFLYHPLAEVYATRDLEHLYRSELAKHVRKIELSEKQVHGAVQEWVEDPWGETMRAFDGWANEPVHGGTRDERLTELLQPPEAIRGLGFASKTLHHPVDAEGIPDFYYEATNGATYYQSGSMDDSIFTNLPAVEEFFRAFQHLGVTARISSRRSGDAWVAEGLTLTVPASTQGISDLKAKRGRHYDHTYTFSPSGANVKCGFVEDEQEWEEWQKRHASTFLQEMEAMVDDDDGYDEISFQIGS